MYRRVHKVALRYASVYLAMGNDYCRLYLAMQWVGNAESGVFAISQKPGAAGCRHSTATFGGGEVSWKPAGGQSRGYI